MRRALGALVLVGTLCAAAAPAAADETPRDPGGWGREKVFAGVIPAMALAALDSDRVLAAGGIDTYVERESNGVSTTRGYAPSKRAAIYSITTDRWAVTPSMKTPRHSAGLVRLRDGRMLVIGGVTGDQIPLSSTEFFDPTTQQWSAGPSLPQSGGRAAVLADGRVLVRVGGDQWALSDPAATRFDIVTPPDGMTGVLFDGAVSPWFRPAFEYSQTTRLVDGSLLAVAESGLDDPRAAVLPVGGTSWEPVASPKTNAAYGFGLLPLAGGSALLLGGIASRTNCIPAFCDPMAEPQPHYVKTTQTFDLATRRWTFVEDTPAEITFGVTTPSGRALLLAEGRSFLFSNDRVVDAVAPRSTTKTGSNDVPTRVSGTSWDVDSGIRRVAVTITPRVAAGKAVVVRDSMTLHCTPGRHRCSWTAKAPRLAPGTYYVSAAATDRAGNIERSAGRRTIVVA